MILGSLLNCFCVTVDGLSIDCMAVNCVTVLRFAIRWKDATNVFNLIEFHENPFSFICIVLFQSLLLSSGVFFEVSLLFLLFHSAISFLLIVIRRSGSFVL